MSKLTVTKHDTNTNPHWQVHWERERRWISTCKSRIYIENKNLGRRLTNSLAVGGDASVVIRFLEILRDSTWATSILLTTQDSHVEKSWSTYIVSCHTEHISEHLDAVLQPFVQSLRERQYPCPQFHRAHQPKPKLWTQVLVLSGRNITVHLHSAVWWTQSSKTFPRKTCN